MSAVGGLATVVGPHNEHEPCALGCLRPPKRIERTRLTGTGKAQQTWGFPDGKVSPGLLPAGDQ